VSAPEPYQLDAAAVEPKPVRSQSVSIGLSVHIRPREETSESSTLAWLPLLPVLLAMCGPALLIPWSLGTILTIAVPTALAQMVLAELDGGKLRSRGFTDLPWSLLALLSPILYLHYRNRRCRLIDPGSRWPLTWAYVSTAIALLIMGAGFALQAAVGGLVPTG